MNIFVDEALFCKMDDIESQLKQIENGVLKWNIAEDITDIQEQVMNVNSGFLQKLQF